MPGCNPTRREAVLTTAGVLFVGASSRAFAPPKFTPHDWRRDLRNPILPPGKDFDVGCCMNPFVLRRGDEYWLYYAGADKSGRQIGRAHV